MIAKILWRLRPGSSRPPFLRKQMSAAIVEGRRNLGSPSPPPNKQVSETTWPPTRVNCGVGDATCTQLGTGELDPVKPQMEGWSRTGHRVSPWLALSHPFLLNRVDKAHFATSFRIMQVLSGWLVSLLQQQPNGALWLVGLGGTENSHSVSGPQEQIMYGYKFCFVSQFACTQRTETLSDTSERQNQVAVSGLNDYHWFFCLFVCFVRLLSVYSLAHF